MNSFEPELVYRNMVIMLTKYRGFTLTEAPLTEQQITDKLNHFGYISFNCERTADSLDHNGRPVGRILGAAKLIAILFKDDSKYADKSPDFKRLIKGFGEEQILAVMKLEPSIHINKHVRETGGRIEIRLYRHFLEEKPLNVAVPPHNIATAEEVDEYCEATYSDRTLFPKINSDDVIGIWMGIRPGMVMRIERVSQNAGVAVAYRYCIK